jgi:excisionase family DNA binding protein
MITNGDDIQLSNKRRKLDELFADQPYLSTTMRARSIHERLADTPKPLVIPVMNAEADEPVHLADVSRQPSRDLTLSYTELSPEESKTELMMRERREKLNRLIPTKTAISEAPENLVLLELHMEGDKCDKSLRANARSMSLSPEVMTLQEAADFLRFSISTIRCLVKDKGMPCAHIGRRIRFRKVAILEWLKEHENKTSNETPGRW